MSAWWAPRSSKPVKGLIIFGGFDSRPPPLINLGLFIIIKDINLGIIEPEK